MQTEVILAIASVICTMFGMMITYIMNGIKESLTELNENVSDLNVKMGVIVERVDGHEKRISHLEG